MAAAIGSAVAAAVAAATCCATRNSRPRLCGCPAGAAVAGRPGVEAVATVLLPTAPGMPTAAASAADVVAATSATVSGAGAVGAMDDSRRRTFMVAGSVTVVTSGLDTSVSTMNSVCGVVSTAPHRRARTSSLNATACSRSCSGSESSASATPPTCHSLLNPPPPPPVLPPAVAGRRRAAGVNPPPPPPPPPPRNGTPDSSMATVAAAAKLRSASGSETSTVPFSSASTPAASPRVLSVMVPLLVGAP